MRAAYLWSFFRHRDLDSGFTWIYSVSVAQSQGLGIQPRLASSQNIMTYDFLDYIRTSRFLMCCMLVIAILSLQAHSCSHDRFMLSPWNLRAKAKVGIVVRGDKATALTDRMPCQGNAMRDTQDSHLGLLGAKCFIFSFISSGYLANFLVT